MLRVLLVSVLPAPRPPDHLHHQPGTLTELGRYLQHTGGMIGSLSHLIRAGALTAILNGSETITKYLLDTILVHHAADSDKQGAA